MPLGPHIAVLLVNSSAFGQLLLQGLAGFRPQGLPWRFEVINAPVEHLAQALRDWQGDGVLTMIVSDAMVPAANALQCPLVNLGGREPGLSYPSVIGNEREVGMVAGSYLLDLGFRQLAYFGTPAAFSCARRDGFLSQLKVSGLERVAVFDDERAGPALASWLDEIEPPAAVFAQDDQAALHVIRMCHRIGRRVPEEVAVLGVNDVWWECELHHPALSSVDSNLAGRARGGAQLLEGLMNGQVAASAPIRVAPRGVVERGSTDIIALQDRAVVSALRFIRERFAEPMSVDDIAEHVGVSRRTLERRFKSCFQRTLSEELWRVRIDAARRLLRDSDLGVLDIATRSGFSSASVFSTTFRRHTGQTPSAFRRQPGRLRHGP